MHKGNMKHHYNMQYGIYIIFLTFIIQLTYHYINSEQAYDRIEISNSILSPYSSLIRYII